MKKYKLLGIFELVVFLDMLNGAYPWFFWNIKTGYLSLLFSVISIIYLKINGIKFNLGSNYGLGLLLLYVSTFFSVDHIAISERFSRLLFFIPILALASDVQNAPKIFSTIAKWFSLLLIPSMLLHVLFLIVGFPPSTIIVNETIPDNYVYFNYILLIKNIVMPDYQIRFCSIFLEPGYLGTLLSFLLYVGRFDFRKWYNIVLLCALILTLSLAGYVISALGWSFIRLQGGKSIKQLVKIVIALGVIYYGGISYNGGNNTFNENILSRLEYDEERGVSGNNRTSHMANAFFEECVNNGNLLLGVGGQKIKELNGRTTKGASFNNQIRGAGYMMFFITNGIIQAIIILLGYIVILKKSESKYSLCFLLLIIITFVQAAYPLSSSWLIPFVLGCLINQHNNENRNINFSSRP